MNSPHNEKTTKSIEALKDFTTILDSRGIKYWIDFGTLLGAFRDGTIIAWDYDIDLCVVGTARHQLELLVRELVDCGKVLRGETRDNAFYQFTYDLDLFRIELYVCSEDGTIIKNHIREQLSIPRLFVDELETIKLGDHYFKAPRHIPRLLAMRYGDDFMTPQRTCDKLNMSWDDVDRHLGDVKFFYSAYTPGVFDMFHVGHVRLFERIKNSFGRLVVGVHSDEQCESYKPKPVIPYTERLEIVRACKYVDEVIENADLITTDKVLDRVKADFAVAGREHPDYIKTYYTVSEARLHLINRTEGISSTDLRSTCARSLKEATNER